jgi:hypothetical protein
VILSVRVPCIVALALHFIALALRFTALALRSIALALRFITLALRFIAPALRFIALALRFIWVSPGSSLSHAYVYLSSFLTTQQFLSCMAEWTTFTFSSCAGL